MESTAASFAEARSNGNLALNNPRQYSMCLVSEWRTEFEDESDHLKRRHTFEREHSPCLADGPDRGYDGGGIALSRLPGAGTLPPLLPLLGGPEPRGFGLESPFAVVAVKARQRFRAIFLILYFNLN